MAKVYATLSVKVIIDTDLRDSMEMLDYLDVNVSGEDESVLMVLDSEIDGINITDSK